MTKVPGKKRKKEIYLYALSTCGWCRKTKEFLSRSGFEYDFVDVDLLSGKAKDRAIAEVKRHNPGLTFPTTVIGDRCIVGFDEPALLEELGR
jgi:glutaredoxin